MIAEFKALDRLLLSTSGCFTIEITDGWDFPTSEPSGLIDVNIILDLGGAGHFRQAVVQVEDGGTFCALMAASDKVADLLDAMIAPVTRKEEV